MSDLMERLAAANPSAEEHVPPIDEVWRKLERARPVRRAWRVSRGALSIAAMALPVLGVLFIASALRGASHRGTDAPVRKTATGGATLDRSLQATAWRQLAGRDGAIVVLDPRTGAVKALVARGGSRTPSATLWPPEATFDVVTAAAALDSGRYTPSSRIPGTSPASISETTVHNSGGASFGSMTIGQALADSVNTVFARVGAGLGASTLTTYMRRFGFYAAPGVAGLPASGARVEGGLVLPSADGVPPGAIAAGQGELTATALQMAMVASTVADGGILAAPHLDAGRAAGSSRRVISARTARRLTEMLRGAVDHGTGTPAEIGRLGIAGKTGTAPAGALGRGTIASFIGFAPAAHPTVAVAVVLRDPAGGFGGTIAAPVAARVVRAALAERRGR